MIETIWRAIDDKGHLPIAASTIALEADLYRAGLTPFAAVQVMLALEKALEIEFPKSMLNRHSMASIDAILSCLRQLQAADTRLQAA
ncbi:MAG: acyl carrier protein [Methylocystaceae bacterium]|nr:MAG: acyl carrier protein [Methylocystaceae bacterium]